MKRDRARRLTKIAVMFFMVAPFAIAVFGFVVKGLWNWLVPQLFHLPAITFWQAIGLVILTRILFGSFHHHHSERDRNRWRRRMWERWNSMTPDEREQFRQRLNRRWGIREPGEASATEK